MSVIPIQLEPIALLYCGELWIWCGHDEWQEASRLDNVWDEIVPFISRYQELHTMLPEGAIVIESPTRPVLDWEFPLGGIATSELVLRLGLLSMATKPDAVPDHRSTYKVGKAIANVRIVQLFRPRWRRLSFPSVSV